MTKGCLLSPILNFLKFSEYSKFFDFSNPNEKYFRHKIVSLIEVFIMKKTMHNIL